MKIVILSLLQIIHIYIITGKKKFKLRQFCFICFYGYSTLQLQCPKLSFEFFNNDISIVINCPYIAVKTFIVKNVVFKLDVKGVETTLLYVQTVNNSSTDSKNMSSFITISLMILMQIGCQTTHMLFIDQILI